MSHRYFVFALLAAAIFCFGTAGGAAKYSKIKITLDSKADYNIVRSFGFDHLTIGEGFAETILAPEDIQRFDATGLKYSVLIEDMSAFYRSRFDQTRSMGGYRTLSEIGLVLDSIHNARPTIVSTKFSIGNSIEARPIWVIKISDNVVLDEDEPEVYYYACHHAREVITPEVLIYFMRYLTNNYGTDPQVTYLVNNRELYFAPCVNPDGYAYNELTNPGGGGLWRKNRRNSGGGNWGVDINRNYGYQWGFDDVGSSPDPSSLTYRGTGPFSEPEIQAQRNFINSRHFKVLLNYHSYSNLFLYPWGYDEIYTQDNDIFVQMGDTVHAMNNYTPGPPWATLYTVNGGAFDWEYGEQITKPKIYALSVEVGTSSDDFWPPTNRITPLVQENLQPNLFYARIAGNPEALRAPVQPILHTIGDVDTSYFNLYWHHADSLNPAQSFEVWQLSDLARITDDLEGSGPAWTSSGFTLETDVFHTSMHSYFGGNSSSIDTRLSTGQTLHVVSGDTLRFWTNHVIESGWDYGYVEISINGGATFAPIPGNITTTDNPHTQNLGNGITGNSGGWTLAKFPLSPWVGQDIMIRFRYKTDGSQNSGGWHIDDVYPVEYYSVATKLSDAVSDTTLLVTGLETKDYYYKVRAKDAQNQYSGFSSLALAHVSFSTQCPWLIADADFSGTIDIGDAVYLINYIFGGGPVPIPNSVGSGDADCSGAVDISDAVYLIAYIFGGGPGPGTTCDCKNY